MHLLQVRLRQRMGNELNLKPAQLYPDYGRVFRRANVLKFQAASLAGQSLAEVTEKFNTRLACHW